MGDRGGNKGRPPTRTCFIGNLPWDIAEPQLKELFAEVGPIKNFRVVADRETGKPKGFGFCEYFDTATAASAQRNLNGHEINGRRIHVDFAEDKDRGGFGDGPRGPRSAPGRAQPALGMDSAQRAAGAMVTLVDGAPPPPVGQNSPDAVTSTLAGMSKGQLYEIMGQMKGLIQQNPGQARQILVQNPQLTKALFQAQIMLGMVPDALTAEPAPAHLNGGGPPNTHHQPPGPQYDPAYPPQQAPPPYEQAGGPPYGSAPAPAASGPPPAAYASAPMGYGPGPGSYPGPGGGEPLQGGYLGVPGGEYAQPPPAYSTAPDWQPAQQQQQPGYGQQPPPQQGAAYGGPRQQPAAVGGDPRQVAGLVSDPRQGYLKQEAQAPYSPSQAQQYTPPQQEAALAVAAPGAAGPALAAQQLDSEQQKALLAQVMNLTPAQIELLPPQQKAQVIALQQQMRQQGGGF